jgi:hypothetical protein
MYQETNGGGPRLRAACRAASGVDGVLEVVEQTIDRFDGVILAGANIGLGLHGVILRIECCPCAPGEQLARRHFIGLTASLRLVK